MSELLRIRALLGQLRQSSVRTDFLAGRIIQNVKNVKRLLKTLDAIYDLLFPDWISNNTGFLTLLSVASDHHWKLLSHSSDLFKIPMEEERPVHLSYSDWMNIICNLFNSGYWTEENVKRFVKCELLEASEDFSTGSSPLLITRNRSAKRKSSDGNVKSVKASNCVEASQRIFSSKPGTSFSQKPQHYLHMEISD